MASRAIKGRHNVKSKSGKAVVLSVLLVIVAAIVAGVIGVLALAASWLQDMPDYTDTDEFSTSQTSVVYAADGKTVLAEFQLENRDPVEMDDISKYVIDGTVATEDERFYSHSGVDLYGSMRALVNNLVGGSLEGGSTITQQLVRNTILSDEMNDISFKRKIREMFIATKVEEMYDKQDILLMYLNTINYGAGAYGIEAAAKYYFSKHANELTLAEAAALVGIPQSPTYNNPVDHIDHCVARRNIVLDRMVSNGYLSQEDAIAAKGEELVLTLNPPSNTGIKEYPYFTSFVRNQLMNTDGKYAFSTAELFAGGLQITTTLDLNDQKAAEQAAINKAEQAGEVFEVAMAAIDPSTGHIKALVGGNNYEESQVNMATGEGSPGRQCGSSFKTYTLVTALEQGIDPNTIIDAGYSVKLEGTDAMVYNSGKASYGSIPISRAFALSSNTAFTRLIMSVGVDKVKEMAQRLGVTSPIQDTAGITLGIDSVTPLEMASAYATIASGGIKHDPECILQIKNRKGEVIVDNSHPEGQRVISEEVAYAAIDVMQGVIKNGTGGPARLANGQPAAGKTGTTEEDKDSWFVGFTPQMASAWWLGERADTYEKAKVVYTTVTSAFADFMDRILKDQEVVQFKEAAKPQYQESYSDPENHVGKGGWSPSYAPNTSNNSSNNAAADDDDDGDDGDSDSPSTSTNTNKGNGDSSGGSSKNTSKKPSSNSSGSNKKPKSN